MNKIRVFITDDHQLVRDGIKSLLADSEDIEVIGEAAGEEELLAGLAKEQPDIILMDISLPGISGITLTKRITEEYPDVQVLILSMYTNEDFISGAIRAGARGYLPKNTSRKELLDAIRSIMDGEEYFSESIARVVMKGMVRKAKESGEEEAGLTSRETEILKLYVDGLINKEIADRLHISIRTVESHKNHIMRKLNVKSTVELVKYAIKKRIVEF